MTKRVVSDVEKFCGTCYFRTSIKPPCRKALLQITQKCNLHCAHCFVSAERIGLSMDLKTIQDILIPRLQQARVVNVTLTGGEPFMHPQILEIAKSMADNGLRVGICSNATLISRQQIEALAAIGNVHINVSMDGFSESSHGKFRGQSGVFEKAKENIEALAEYGLLQGILATPNQLAKDDEYLRLCEFAQKSGAQYVLMNPLSSMGRGMSCQQTLRAADETMSRIKTLANKVDIEKVFVRFPNEQKLPLVSCEAGNIIYIFADGQLTVCPYLVFAAKNPQSNYASSQFIAGNIFQEVDIATKLDAFPIASRCYPRSPKCWRCPLEKTCGRGCLAAMMTQGLTQEDLDPLCPMI